MRKSGFFQGLVLWAAVLVFLPSCSPLPRGTSEERGTRIDSETVSRAQQQFALGKYDRALELFSAAYDTYQDGALRRSYVSMGEQIRSAADASYRERDFAAAGTAYGMLVKSGITERDFAQMLSFNSSYLSGRIIACSKALMEMGMIKYREEKIEEAISIWKKALLFDKDNRNINNAIDTATVQLQQLMTLQ